MEHYRTDFTVGNIPRHLLTFAIPMLVGNLLQTFYNTVDSIWVGRFLGPGALAAVSVSFPVLFLFVAFATGLGIGNNVMIAQYLGAKKEEEVTRTITNALTVFTVIGLFTMIVGLLFHQSTLKIIKTPDEIMPLASSYLLIFLLGLPFLFLYNAINTIFQGMGNSRTPLRLLVYATVLNVILDPILILGIGPFPRMGIAGAALATTISQGVSGILGLFALRKTGFVRFTKGFIFSPQLSRIMFRLGLPASAQQTVLSLGFLMMTSIVNAFGKNVIAAFGAGSRVDQFAFLPAMTFSLAISSVAGQNLGALNFQRAKDVARWGAIISSLFAGVTTVVIFLITSSIIHIFTTDPQVLELGIVYLRIASFSYLPLALMFAYNGFLRGAGDTFQAMLNTILTLWIVRIPLAKILSSLPQLQERGIWISQIIGPTAGFLIAYGYYLTGRWQNKILVRPSQEESISFSATQAERTS
ncbi:MAG: MATE family efflux transporter [Candidatus Caldatribacteriaceae bacterium]